MDKIKQKYIYSGPVYSFGELISSCWEAETWATGPAKAESNLKYRYRIEHNLACNTRIELGERPSVSSYGGGKERSVRYES